MILLVEDNEDSRAIYCTLLRRSGYQVLEAADGGMAVTMLTWVRPHLVLLDIALPSLDGWTVARWAKSDAETSTVPIVAITALSRSEHRAQADHLGFAEYLTKPIEPVDLLNCVQRLIGPPVMEEEVIDQIPC